MLGLSKALFRIQRISTYFKYSQIRVSQFNGFIQKLAVFSFPSVFDTFFQLLKKYQLAFLNVTN